MPRCHLHVRVLRLWMPAVATAYHLSSQALPGRHALSVRRQSGEQQVVTVPGQKKTVSADDAATSLVEVGPRACLQPIKIFAGSFGGPVLYENPAYVSPNKVRTAMGNAHALYF